MLAPQAVQQGQGAGMQDLATGHRQAQQPWAWLKQEPASEEAMPGLSGTSPGAVGCQGCPLPGIPRSSPVELEHAAGEGHAPWHLEGHPPNEVHLLAAVRVEG